MEITEKNKFLGYIEGTKALAHLLIAQLSLISSKGINFIPIYSDGSTGNEINIEIPKLLRQMQFFPVNEFDHSIQYRFPLKTSADILEGSQKDELIKLLLNTALCIPIVRIYELILDYCKKTDQIDQFKKTEWYDVARIIRNCFSHNFILKIDKKTKERLPLTWKNIKITEETIDKPLKYPNSSISNLTSLFDEMTAFGKILN